MIKKLLGGVFAIILFIIVALSILAMQQRAPDIDGSETTSGPLAWWSQKLMQGLFDYRVWSQARSGYIAMFARDGEIVYATTSGYANVEEQIPMALNTRARIASLTKPVTAVAAMILLDEGKLNLDDPVSMYIPAAANLRVASSHQRDAAGSFDTQPLSKPLLVRHLLMFASGIGGSGAIGGKSDLDALWQEKGLFGSSAGNLQQRIDQLLTLPLFEEPGTKWRYGGSADVMARVIEVAAAQPFTEFLQQRIFQPLGMNDTGHLPPPNQQDDLARVYTQTENGELALVEWTIEEESDWTPGGSGLVSTVPDYMRFGLMLRNGGELNGVRILQQETVTQMTTPQISGVLAERDMQGMGWGLGMAVVEDQELTMMTDRNGDYWWAGYFGTYWAVSPTSDLVSVVFSQYEPGPHTDIPLVVHMVSGVALMGLSN